MEIRVEIRDFKEENHPRIFDVFVDEEGIIQRYECKNIRGKKKVDALEVKRQIDEALIKQRLKIS